MSELAKAFAKRSEGAVDASAKPFNAASDFPEFSRKQLQTYQKMFNTYDTDKSGRLDLMKLKFMMEKLGNPQTHVSLKAMIKAVDEDLDDQISYREFLLIFRRAALGELKDLPFSTLVDYAKVI